MTPVALKILLVALCALGQLLLAAWIVFTPPAHRAAGRRQGWAVVASLALAALLIAATGGIK